MKSIAVFCGASKGASDIYIESAKDFGTELAKRNITLVYWGFQHWHDGGCRGLWF